jgi:hypothetical protein
MLTSPTHPVRGCRKYCTCVSLSPSKIPFRGLFPVRLQMRSSSRDLRRPKGGLIRGASSSACFLWPRRASVLLGGKHSPERSHPGVLGLSAGCIMPVAHGLRTHVSFSISHAASFPSSRRVSSRSLRQASAKKFHNLPCLSLSSGPPSVPWQTPRLFLVVPSSRELTIPTFARGSTFACSPPEPAQEDSLRKKPTWANRPVPATRLTPARQAELWPQKERSEMSPGVCRGILPLNATRYQNLALLLTSVYDCRKRGRLSWLAPGSPRSEGDAQHHDSEPKIASGPSALAFLSASPATGGTAQRQTTGTQNGHRRTSVERPHGRRFHRWWRN